MHRLLPVAFHLYILANPESEIYVGQTGDLQRRLAQHNDPQFRGTLHTKRHAGPWRLLHAEQFTTRAEAMQRERALKGAQGRQWIRDTLLGGC